MTILGTQNSKTGSALDWTTLPGTLSCRRSLWRISRSWESDLWQTARTVYGRVLRRMRRTSRKVRNKALKLWQQFHGYSKNIEHVHRIIQMFCALYQILGVLACLLIEIILDWLLVSVIQRRSRGIAGRHSSCPMCLWMLKLFYRAWKIWRFLPKPSPQQRRRGERKYP